MTDRTNQHFVPQFYFRHFSSDRRTIGTLLTRDGRTITRASIKGQCARSNFYGSQELEAILSQLEGHHCIGIRAVLDVANSASAPPLSDEELFYFFQAIMLQRGRTALEIDKAAPAIEGFALESFKQFLKHKYRNKHNKRDAIIRHIEAGNLTVAEAPSATVARSLSIALDSTVGITDLHICLLRNRTDYPFIFSDAPVVFYNSYCRNVRNRGVLGLQSPGLQIFYPLDSWTTALLLDPAVYEGPFQKSLTVDLHSRADVSQINALQLHHSLNAVYFGNPLDDQYVYDLWYTHQRSIRPIRDNFIVGAKFLVDGKPPAGELIQIFEPQIGCELNLSFIHCEPIAETDYVYTPRSPELRDELRRSEQSWDDQRMTG